MADESDHAVPISNSSLEPVSDCAAHDSLILVLWIDRRIEIVSALSTHSHLGSMIGAFTYFAEALAMSTLSIEELDELIFCSRQEQRNKSETTIGRHKFIPGKHSSQNFDGARSVQNECLYITIVVRSSAMFQLHYSMVPIAITKYISRCSITPTFQMSSVDHRKSQQLSNLDSIMCRSVASRLTGEFHLLLLVHSLPTELSNLSFKKWKPRPNHSRLLVYSSRSTLQAIYEAVRSLRTVSISVECSQCSSDSKGRRNNTHERALG
jgi:hypothetical protein